jgi:dTMP kinase
MLTSLCSVGDWLSLLAQTSLATKLTVGYQAQSFALGGVVATKLLPAMFLAPLAGALADRFDRRKVMVVCDVLRCSLLISVPIVGSLWWLLAVVFLVEICSLFWIPAKDASVPNLLHRPDQVETANQISLVMTYGVAVVAASGIFSGLSTLGPQLHLAVSHTGTVYVALVITAMAYLTSAVVVATRIKEISGRARGAARPQSSPGLFRLLHDGVRFVGSTPLIRGLVLGILGAFAAGGAVIASGKPYAASLSGGDASYGMLFAAVFIGLGTGMATAPKFAKRLPHNRLFGVAIVTAGFALVLVALAPHLWIALVTVALVGCCAGVAFLTGLTIIGSRVEDEVRGRTVAFVQSLVRVDLLASMAVVPLMIGLVQPRTLAVFGVSMRIDGTRPVLLGAGILAAALGLIAYRQMQHQRGEPILSDLVTVLRPATRRTAGLLIAVEGDTADTSAQAERLAGWLLATGYDVVHEHDSAHDAARLRGVLAGASLSSLRAKALVAAAVRADAVEHRVRPALDAGALVVMERYVDSPLARVGAAGGLDPAELDRLADWATGKLRPDITVLLDRGPAAPGSGPGRTPASSWESGPAAPGADSGVVAGGNGAAAPEWYLNPAAHGDGGAAPGFGNVEHHWLVYRLLTEMAAADPDRYLVVDAEGTVDEVADRVRTALLPALTARMRVGGPDTDLATAELP